MEKGLRKRAIEGLVRGTRPFPVKRGGLTRTPALFNFHLHMSSVYDIIPTFNSEGQLNAVVDTPKGSRNKYKFNEKLGFFELGGVEPAGMSFPFNFGFIPGTRGGDGDPLDVLIMLDEPAFVGCVIAARVIGVIEAKQTEDGKTMANHRLIAVASNAPNLEHLKKLKDLNPQLIDEIEHFFVSYNEMKGKRFKPLGRYGPRRGKKLIRTGIKKAES
jgi:inorganic pyrophosphatase